MLCGLPGFVGSSEQVLPLVLPGLVLGQVQQLAPGTGREPGRDVDDPAVDRAGPGLGALTLGQDTGGAGEIISQCRSHQPGRIRGELPRGQVGQGAVLEIGIDLLDPGMLAMDLIGSDRVQHLGVHGGEERMEMVGVKERQLPHRGLWIQFGDTAHDQAPGDLLGLLPGRESGERYLRDLRRRNPCLGVFVIGGVGVLDLGPRVLRNFRDRGFHGLVHRHRDRDISATGQCRADTGVAIVGRIKTTNHRPRGVHALECPKRFGNELVCPASRVCGPFTQTLANNDQGGGQDGVQPTDLRVAIAGAMLQVPMDLDNRVINIDKDEVLRGPIPKQPRRPFDAIKTNDTRFSARQICPSSKHNPSSAQLISVPLNLRINAKSIFHERNIYCMKD